MPITIFVDGLSPTVTPDALHAVFAPFRPTQIVIARHRSGTPLGFGFVLLPTAAEAQEAIQAVNGRDLLGKRLRVAATICPDAIT
jgi:RNA recognition motif-containing protein